VSEILLFIMFTMQFGGRDTNNFFINCEVQSVSKSTLTLYEGNSDFVLDLTKEKTSLCKTLRSLFKFKEVPRKTPPPKEEN